MILLKRYGNELVDFISGDAPMVPAEDAHVRLTYTQVAVQHEGKTLLIFERERQQWEIPGGGLESGEHPDDCARREVWEESGQVVETLTYQGLFKLRFKHDGHDEYGALYTATIREIQPFEPNEEIDRIALWDGIEVLEGYFSDLTQVLLDFC